MEIQQWTFREVAHLSIVSIRIQNVCSCGGTKTVRNQHQLNPHVKYSFTIICFSHSMKFIEKRNSFLAHVNPSGPTHVIFIMVFDGIVSQSSAPRVISQQPLVFFCDSLQFRKFNQTDPLFCWQKTTVRQPALCMSPVKCLSLFMSSCEIAIH